MRNMCAYIYIYIRYAFREAKAKVHRCFAIAVALPKAAIAVDLKPSL